MSLLNQLEQLEQAIGYAEMHLTRAVESPTERQVELSDWLDDAYVRRERLLERMEIRIGDVDEAPVFSTLFRGFSDWSTVTTRSTAYTNRIVRYMAKHPGATLKAARGHG